MIQRNTTVKELRTSRNIFLDLYFNTTSNDVRAIDTITAILAQNEIIRLQNRKILQLLGEKINNGGF